MQDANLQIRPMNKLPKYPLFINSILEKINTGQLQQINSVQALKDAS